VAAALAGGLVMVVAAGCGAGGAGDGAARGISDDEVKIGASFPRTGPFAVYGALGNGMEAQFKSVNAEGGVKGRKIAFTVLDDGYDPATMLSAGEAEALHSPQVETFAGAGVDMVSALTMTYVDSRDRRNASRRHGFG